MTKKIRIIQPIVVLALTISMLEVAPAQFREGFRFNFVPRRTTILNRAFGTTTATALDNQVKTLQHDLEENFEDAPSIVERVYASPTSNVLVDYSDLQDSALLTGIYLASQCFKESVGTTTEKAEAEGQIQWALGSIENLFDVTGTPGLLTRFAFDTTDSYVKNLGFARSASVQNGAWVASRSLPHWLWMPGTSRDQYTGVLFGLGICHQLSKDKQIVARTGARIQAAVNMLVKNNWNIPGSTGGTSSKILLSTQAAWLKLAALSAPNAVWQRYWEDQYKPVMDTLMNNVLQKLEDEINPTVINNFQEYYSWNLGYERMYPILLFEKNPTYVAYFRNYVVTKMWNETWNHGNSEFTFMKIGSMGVESYRDQAALPQAIESLNELAFRTRRDFPVNNSNDPTLGRNNVVLSVTNWATSNGIPSSSFVSSQQAANAIPMRNRVPNDFMWQQSPFQLAGGGQGNIEAPPVDTIFSYWLGHYHNLINAKSPSEISLGNIANSNLTVNPVSSAPVGNPNVSYIATLNYHGTISTATESDVSLQQSYSGVVEAGSMFFTSIHDDIVKAINSAANKLPGSHSINVQLGDAINGDFVEIKMQGQKVSTKVEIDLPSINADVGVKIEKAWGLIELKCDESIALKNLVVTGNLDVNAGTLSSIRVNMAAPVTNLQCEDNIPLFGWLIADLAEHFGDQAIAPTIAKFNAPGGYPLSNVNFGGLNKLLKSGTLVVNGQDYGKVLSDDLNNVLDNDNIDLAIYDPANSPADDAGDFRPGGKLKIIQPLVVFKVVDPTNAGNNISLSVEKETVRTNNNFRGYRGEQP